MFGRDRSAHGQGQLVHGVGHAFPLIEEMLLVGANRLRHVEMHVAVAEMAERNRAAAGNQFLDKCGCLADELRHLGNRHGDVVLD